MADDFDAELMSNQNIWSVHITDYGKTTREALASLKAIWMELALTEQEKERELDGIAKKAAGVWKSAVQWAGQFFLICFLLHSEINRLFCLKNEKH